MPEIGALQIAPIYYFYSRTPDHMPLFSKIARSLPAVLILRFSSLFEVSDQK